MLYLCQAGHLLIGMQHDVAMKVNCEESFFRKTYAGEHYRYSRASRASWVDALCSSPLEYLVFFGSVFAFFSSRSLERIEDLTAV